MEKRDVEKLLGDVASGLVSIDDAVVRIQSAPMSDLGFACVDHARGMRQGVSEVIYGEGKTADQIAGIIASMLDAGQERVLITRLDADKALEIQTLLAAGLVFSDEAAADGQDSPSDDVPDMPMFTYYDLPHIALVGAMPEPDGLGSIVIATGGTSDIPVAEEAALTAEVLGNEVVRMYDVGVAGIHRLLARTEELERARVIVAIAGMEGALASVIAGLASCPVIAVPTSVGYGASFGGLSALLSMLNSCASGVSVVNIDNGFGAGYQASLINHVK